MVSQRLSLTALISLMEPEAPEHLSSGPTMHESVVPNRKEVVECRKSCRTLAMLGTESDQIVSGIPQRAGFLPYPEVEWHRDISTVI